VTDQNTRNQTVLGSTIQMLQLAVLIIGVAGIFLTIGRRDQILENNQTQVSDLRLICSDLARVVGSLSISDASQTEQLRSIDARLNRLETK
jgi:23S rRNA U2552 (ribose-2'-O)-methylase RlmE/FtsJ